MNFIVKSIRRFPYLFLTLFFALGVVLEYNFRFGYIYPICVASSFVSAILMFACYIKSRQYGFVLFSVTFLMFTFLFLGGWSEYACHPISSNRLDSLGATGLSARVAKIGSVPKLTKSRRVSCEADVYCDEAHAPIRSMLTFDTSAVSFKKGDCVIFSSSLKSTESNETVGFNYDTYLRKKGVEATALTKQYRLIDSVGYFSLESHASKLNIALQKSLRDRDCLAPDERDLIIAITLGSKTEMDDGLKDAYSKAGASHLLAVSGLHVGIIILLVESLVGFVIHPKRRPFIFAISLLSIIWGYAFLTGLAASVVRTSLMYTVYRVAMLLFSKANPINVVSFAAFVMLVYNPFNIFDLGFQLSFLAVYSILFFGQTLVRRFEHWMPEITIEGVIGHGLGKLRQYVLGSVAISISAQILTTPIILFTFHSLPILSIASSLVTIPLVSLLIPLAFLYYGFLSLSTIFDVLTPVGNLVLYIASFVAEAVNAVVYYTADISFCTVDRIPFYHYDVVACIVIFLLVAAYHNYRRIVLLWLAASVSVVYFATVTVDGFETRKRNMLAVYNVNGVTAVNRMTETNTLFGCGDTLKVAKKANEFWTNNLMVVPSSTVTPYFAFGKDRVYILSDKEEVKREIQNPLNVDVLVLANNVASKFSELKNFRFKKLIIDSSNKSFVAKRWEEERKKSGEECHIVRIDGSWMEKAEK